MLPPLPAFARAMTSLASRITKFGIDGDVAAVRLRRDAARFRADQRVRRHDLTPRGDDDVAAGRVRGARANRGRVERERILSGHDERAGVAPARAARRQQPAGIQHDRVRREHDVAAVAGVRSRARRLARDARVRDLEMFHRDVDLAAVAGEARVADDLRAVRQREARRANRNVAGVARARTFDFARFLRLDLGRRFDRRSLAVAARADERDRAGRDDLQRNRRRRYPTCSSRCARRRRARSCRLRSRSSPRRRWP